VAKLKARGREEIFRVERVRPPAPGNIQGIAEVRDYRVLASDGNVLERMVLHYTPEEAAKNYGKKSHDYGWKVRGRARSGLTLEQLLKLYLDKGWQLAEASDAYFTVSGDSIESISQEPFISIEKAAKRSEGLARQRSKKSDRREAHAKESDGPGYYVTNEYVGSSVYRNRVADHPRPFEHYEQAEEFAVRRLQHFREFSFDYLLPVLVISSQSRQAAEEGSGDVLWMDGRSRGPAVDPRQQSLF
jgi:hypothetical protein